MIHDSTVMDLLTAGMRAESLRQQTIANNIANINTDGFRRSEIDFEEVLAKALDKQGPFDPDTLKPEIFQPEDTPINEFGSDVGLDHEVGEMAKNSLRHRAYMLVLKKKYQQMDEAMKF
ncbi:MAG: flagellar basal body rod protein FlgB [Phycisphaerae bacterium]|nr:flagellar basal body rod protein FlgB [Phycisphaerae bacterium]